MNLFAFVNDRGFVIKVGDKVRKDGGKAITAMTIDSDGKFIRLYVAGDDGNVMFSAYNMRYVRQIIYYKEGA